MIVFKELILENFGPYKGKNIINLSPQNNGSRSPIILFGGMNGGGKTTLMDSIRLALYGRRAECSNRDNLSYNDFLLQSINKKIELGEKTRIELTLEHLVDDRPNELKIVRHWQANVKDGKDNLGIIEGEFPDLNLTQNWDEYIEKFLPLGISNLFLFDGEQVKELAEQELPSAKVKDAIKSLLGLELADKLSFDLDLLLNRKQKDLDHHTALDELEKIEQSLVNLETQKTSIIQDLKIAENQLRSLQKKYNQASKNLRAEGLKIATKTEKLKLEKLHLQEQIQRIFLELLKLSTQSLPLGFISNLLQDLQTQLVEEWEYKQLANAQVFQQQRDEKLLSLLKQIEIRDQQYEQIRNFLEQENTQSEQRIKQANIYLSAAENTLPKLKQILLTLLPKQQVETQEKLALLTELRKKITNIEEQLLQIDSPQDYKLIEKEVKKAEKNLVKAKSNCEIIKKTLVQIEQDIVVTRKKLSNYSEDNIKNQQVQHLVATMPKVKQTLSLFQEKLTLRKLNKLESEVTSCFRYLLHKDNLISRIAIDIDTFALSLYNQEGSLIAKKRLSAGEKQLLAISLLWGLARVSGKNLPIAIDTPLARLDSSHRYNLIERYFPTASHQVILLSTDTEIAKSELNLLRDQDAIAREYLLDYDSNSNLTTVKAGYFW